MRFYEIIAEQTSTKMNVIAYFGLIGERCTEIKTSTILYISRNDEIPKSDDVSRLTAVIRINM